MISTDDYCWFVDRTLDQIVSVLEVLGDDLASEGPELTGANSPYGIVTHCVGVMATWGGHFVAGREVVRDRATEFQTTGHVSDLVTKIEAARIALRSDVASAQTSAPPRNSPAPADAALPLGRTQGGALIHLYEELVQHLGQLEITRDLLLASNSTRASRLGE